MVAQLLAGVCCAMKAGGASPRTGHTSWTVAPPKSSSTYCTSMRLGNRCRTKRVKSHGKLVGMCMVTAAAITCMALNASKFRDSAPCPILARPWKDSWPAHVPSCAHGCRRMIGPTVQISICTQPLTSRSVGMRMMSRSSWAKTKTVPSSPCPLVQRGSFGCHSSRMDLWQSRTSRASSRLTLLMGMCSPWKACARSIAFILSPVAHLCPDPQSRTQSLAGASMSLGDGSVSIGCVAQCMASDAPT
mmetsp:Transcript_110155/g.218825  ORF Transcript_110155/g.218825 Transcript_110155/m.218825 type:complete len:246 (+) Transcript_110155:617-1354(+)